MFPDINPNIDTAREEYEAQFSALVALALAGELSRRDFVEQLTDIVIAALMAAYLAGGGNPSAMDNALADEISTARKSIRKFAADLYNGRYTESEDNPQPPNVDNRIGLWMFGFLAAYAIGQQFIRDQLRRYRWNYDPAKDHCDDCMNLNGVVLTMAEWRRLGVAPQSRVLECSGYQCGCYWTEIEAESIGIVEARRRLQR